MEGLWFVSYVVLWFVVALEGLMLIVALRQIGTLLVGRGPRAARAVEAGPKVGEKTPEVIREDLDGQLVTIGAETKHDTLLILVSHRCPPCRALMPGVATLAANRKKENLEIVLMSREDKWPHEEGEQRIKGVHYVVYPELVSTFQIASTPFAFLLDKQGVVLTKGIANDIQHLESLLTARDVGVPTAADLAERERNRSEQKRSLPERMEETSAEAQETMAHTSME